MKTKRIADYALNASAIPSRRGRKRQAQKHSTPAVPAHTALSARVRFDSMHIITYGALLQLPCVMYFVIYERSGVPGACVQEPAMGWVYHFTHSFTTYGTELSPVYCMY